MDCCYYSSFVSSESGTFNIYRKMDKAEEISVGDLFVGFEEAVSLNILVMPYFGEEFIIFLK